MQTFKTTIIISFLLLAGNIVYGQGFIKHINDNSARYLIDDEKCQAYVEVAHNGEKLRCLDLDELFLDACHHILLGTYEVRAKNGKTYYLFVNRFRFGMGHPTVFSRVSAYEVVKDKLVPAKLFKTKTKSLPEIEYTFDDKPFFFYYDTIVNIDDNCLYLADIEPIGDDDQIEEYYNSSKFLKYRFDGNRFVFEGVCYPYWLHESMKGYKYTEFVLKTTGAGTNYIIQIDMMPDGTWRYAAWKGASRLMDMKRKPDVIVGNGYYNEAEKIFAFDTKDGYTYAVDDRFDEFVLKVFENKMNTLLMSKKAELFDQLP